MNNMERLLNFMRARFGDDWCAEGHEIDAIISFAMEWASEEVARRRAAEARVREIQARLGMAGVWM